MILIPRESLAISGYTERPLKLIALIEEPRVVRKILDHLGLPTDIPSPRPARSPPLGLDEEMTFVDP
jgi:hypothetical protein